MKDRKYIWLTLGAALVSVLGVLAGIFWTGRDGSRYREYYAYLIVYGPVFALLAFCFVWPLAIFVDYGIWRIRKLGSKTAQISSQGKIRLILAAIMLCGSGGIVGKQLLVNHQENDNLELAKSPSIDTAWALSFVDEFMRATKNHGMLFDRNAAAFSALLENPNTPPPLLVNTAARLDSNSAFLATSICEPDSQWRGV